MGTCIVLRFSTHPSNHKWIISEAEVNQKWSKSILLSQHLSSRPFSPRKKCPRLSVRLDGGFPALRIYVEADAFLYRPKKWGIRGLDPMYLVCIYICIVLYCTVLYCITFKFIYYTILNYITVYHVLLYITLYYVILYYCILYNIKLK